MSHEAQLKVHPDAFCPELPEGDLWVFAYGSLLWRPGFDYLQQLPAHLFGYHRSLCAWSFTHRGTVDKPGMVLGLDQGGSCRGCVYRVAEAHKAQTAAYLFAREMPTPLYRGAIHPVQLDDGRRVEALTFIVNRNHPQYAGRLPPEQTVGYIKEAAGISGSSRDYLFNTLAHLDALGLKDRHLSRIAELL